MTPDSLPDDSAWERTAILIGAGGVERLRRAHVLVAGLGGVGSYTAEALARAGIGALTLADHDRVAPSNLNRQLVALRSTIGRRKTEVMAGRVREINPDCRLTLIDDFLSEDQMAHYLAPGFDQIVDAIDSLGSKVALIETAVRLGVPLVSSMGAGGRLDPTRVRAGDLMETRVCPLAREVRSRLRRRGIGRRDPAAARKASSTSWARCCDRAACPIPPARAWTVCRRSSRGLRSRR